MYLAESWVNVYRYQNGKVKLKMTDNESIVYVDVPKETDEMVRNMTSDARGLITELTDPKRIHVVKRLLEYVIATRLYDKELTKRTNELEAELELCKPLQPLNERVSDFSEQSDGLIASIVSIGSDTSSNMSETSKIEILTTCITSMNEHVKTLRNHSNDLEDRLDTVAKILKR